MASQQACRMMQGEAAPAASLPSCIPAAIAGTLGSGSPNYRSTSGTTPNRLFRDGIPSSCAAPKSTPTIYGPGPFRYDAYTFMNYGEPACVTAELSAPAGSCWVHADTYRGSFNPADVQANYLADSGNSAGPGGASRVYSFTVATNGKFVVVVSEPFAGSATCHYTLKVTGTTGCPQVWGYVFLDTDGNGVKDAAEKEGVPRVRITLTPEAGGAVLTGWHGYYLFASVPPGDYCAAAAIPAGYVSTTPANVCLNVRNNAIVNFGVQGNTPHRVFLPFMRRR